MGKENTESKILKILLKQFSITWTVTSLSNEIKISRVGIWKVLKKLEKEGVKANTITNPVIVGKVISK